MTAFSLGRLEKIIEARAQAGAETSYTKSLLDGGLPRIAKKFGEEAVETIIAALGPDRAALIAESADTLYHLLVLLHSREVRMDEVLSELERRTAVSGHVEKAQRPKQD